MTRDLTAFKNYKPKYVQAFLDALILRLADLVNLVDNKIKMGEVKKMTEDLYGEVEGMRPMLYSYEGYVEDAEEAGTLNEAMKDFRFKFLRKAISSKDVDKVILEALTNWQTIDNNLTPIKDQGYTDAMHTAYQDMIADIDSKNTTRNLKMEEKEAIVQANMDFLNGIYKDCMRICNDGKRIYKYTSKDKLKDYTMSAIRRRISNIPAAATAKKVGDAYIAGQVRDFETEEPLANKKVWTNDNLTGVMTDADGRYKIKVDSGKVTNIYCEIPLYDKFDEDVEVEAKVTMELDIEMEKTEVVAPDAPPVA
ncbi:MAG: carboxypeptidase-like regulatory domain-containing protein [Bacteroidota bacterium]